VAREAGVSVATVSRALRGLDGVSPRTRQRVQQAATALDYLASPSAISLASGRTSTVGVVTPVLTRWLFAALVSSIERTVRGHGYHALLLDLQDSAGPAPARGTGNACATGGDGPTRLRLTRDMLWKRVDGLIALDVALTEPELALVRKLGLPLVTIGNRLPGWPAVGTDPETAVAAAVEHLLQLGHVEIAYVATRPVSSRESRQRLEAFVTAMRRRGLEVRSSLLLASVAAASNAARTVLPMLSAQRPPTAVVAGCDEIAIGVLAAARRCGLQVPEELSVVGTDDHAFAEALGLTTIRQDVEAQGRTAASMLIDRILEPPDTRMAESVVVPTGLVIRESTAPPIRRSEHP
jgi:LacI family repressor for deo operon, udp, cdd, tsx, nupC, and nupG